MNVRDLVGSWIVVRGSLAGDYKPGSDYYHFTENMIFWDWPHESKMKCAIFRYQPIEGGIHMIPRTQDTGWDIYLKFEDPLLCVTTSQGNKSWFKRLSPQECPDDASRYIFSKNAEQGAAANP